MVCIDGCWYQSPPTYKVCQVWRPRTVVENVCETIYESQTIRKQVPITVCRQVPYTVCKQVPVTTSQMVPEVHVKMVPVVDLPHGLRDGRQAGPADDLRDRRHRGREDGARHDLPDGLRDELPFGAVHRLQDGADHPDVRCVPT